MSIKVYNKEKELGLENKIINCGSVSISSTVLKRSEKKPVTIAVELYGEEYAKNMAKYLPPDIAMVNSILVSTNWNKNDDVFSPEETWAARYSPVLKPVNIDHQGRENTANKIIGVITDARAVDDNYQSVYSTVQDGKEIIPSSFNILCSTALWQAYFPDAVGTILDRIDENKQYVSMECLFNDFGFALKEENSDVVNLLPRNDVTAWLTASLRVYGGKGTVNINGKNYTIGRWLRSITFSGIGYVENPANEKSIVFQDYVAHANTKYNKINDADLINWEEKEEYLSKSDDYCVSNNSTLGNIELWP